MKEREVGTDLLESWPPAWLLAGGGFSGRAFAAEHAARGTIVIVPPAKDQHKNHAHGTPEDHRRVAQPRRDQFQGDHRSDGTGTQGACTFWGLLTRAAATLAAHALLHVCLADLIDA